jgi:hypothetical protein
MTGLGLATTAVVSNITRPGETLAVGDRSLLQISGDPNSDVWVNVIFPSGETGHTKFGRTDASGNFSSQQPYSASDVGHWHMVWSVGEQPAEAMDVEVLAESETTIVGETPPFDTGVESILPAGTSIPTWVWIAGAAALAWFAFGRKA